MTVQETSTSRSQQLIDLVHSCVPGIRGYPSMYSIAFRYTPKQKVWIFTVAGDSDVLALIAAPPRADGSLRYDGTDSIFAAGEWEDIRFAVHWAGLFDAAVQIATAYEKLTGKSATVQKLF